MQKQKTQKHLIYEITEGNNTTLIFHFSNAHLVSQLQ